ncbi:MSMEG_0568 family radical SAM protein [Paraconexibacter algicola]|uniref:MSMEG_0568 family radical SAM protein n=1 Tax=Paraconexibacter algicola TaxID=2133960 RepID=A0A2T4UG26_9ACTN|nr:MSMEG_0568 family radical SAM protein [Paraconexibacter algicola]PTL58204.1 MSMEG_0568 family radical SAM protein [Paraconexibacter algicola]
MDLRSELAVRGIRSRPAVSRRAGAGPSDDGHWILDGRSATLPVVEDSPFELHPGGTLTRDGVVVDDAMLEPIVRPRFYDLTTEDGTPYEALARLHGTEVLATTVVQTCIRYTHEDTRCRFCTIEESLRSGATVQVKSPELLAEVAHAAVELDGIRQMVMTTGTSNGPDRGAKHLSKCVAAVRSAVPGLPIQVQIEPPLDLSWITTLHEAGATALGIHVEALDETVRARWTPGKATVPMARYEEAWQEAVRVFGRNRVSTYLLVGLGEDPDELVAGAERLIEMGVYPFVVPYRPLAGSLAHADGVPAPDPATLMRVTRRVARALREADMRGADQVAGCAACGACSALGACGG